MSDNQNNQQSQGSDNQDGERDASGDSVTQEQGFDFAAWLAGQDEATRTGIEQHFSTDKQKLQDALKKERDIKKDLADQLKKLKDATPAGADTSEIEAMQQRIAESTVETKFYEQAIPAKVKDGRAAYLIAKDRGYISKSGECNWKALKDYAPYLFEQPAQARGNAGTGTQQQTGQVSAKEEFNMAVRKAAGY